VANTRDRIVSTTAELFGRQGYNGTGLKQIVATAQAPFGSLYHFFPGGKEQLGAEVIRWSGAVYGQLLAAVFDPAPDVATAIGDFFAGAAAHLEDTDYADACPIATVALEVASTSDTLRQATADVFASWIAALTERFVAAGIDPVAGRGLAVNALGALEGAFVLSRALRSVEPLELAGAATRAAVHAALAPPPAARGGRRRSG
jgi:AcrR family transcriptional regulator